MLQWLLLPLLLQLWLLQLLLLLTLRLLLQLLLLLTLLLLLHLLPLLLQSVGSRQVLLLLWERQRQMCLHQCYLSRRRSLTKGVHHRCW